MYLIISCVAGFESDTVPCSENEMFESTEDQVFAIASDLTKRYFLDKIYDLKKIYKWLLRILE
jgi:hypothetical protein